MSEGDLVPYAQTRLDALRQLRREGFSIIETRRLRRLREWAGEGIRGQERHERSNIQDLD
jgi:hypothetical protein